MTAKEKAEELVGKYYTLFPINDYSLAKESALIAVKEILSLFINECEDTRFWNEVKKQIELL